MYEISLVFLMSTGTSWFPDLVSKDRCWCSLEKLGDVVPKRRQWCKHHVVSLVSQVEEHRKYKIGQNTFGENISDCFFPTNSPLYNSLIYFFPSFVHHLEAG